MNVERWRNYEFICMEHMLKSRNRNTEGRKTELVQTVFAQSQRTGLYHIEYTNGKRRATLIHTTKRQIGRELRNSNSTSRPIWSRINFESTEGSRQEVRIEMNPENTHGQIRISVARADTGEQPVTIQVSHVLFFVDSGSLTCRIGLFCN